MAKTVEWRAIDYERLSKRKRNKAGQLDPTHTAQTLENQHDINEGMSKQYGIPIVRRYQDEDESASKYRKKKEKPPGWANVLRDLKTGVANVVFVSAWDRGSREGLASVVEIAEVLGPDGRFITGNYGEINLKDAHGRIHAGIIAELAAGYSEAISVKAKIGLKARAQTLPHAGGYEPYGHHTNGTLIDDEVKHIRQMFDWLTLEGLSASAVAKRLNEQGITAKRGGPWSGSSVALMFRQPRMTGHNVVEIEGEQVRFKVWVPILEEDEHTAVLAVLAQSPAQRKHAVSINDTSLLNGLIRCPDCKQNLSVYIMQNRGKELPRYKCNKRYKGVTKDKQKGCEVSISQPFADAYVVAQVAAIHGTALSPLQHSPDTSVEERREMLRAEIKDLTEREEAITEEFNAKRYPPAKWREDRRAFLDQIETAQAQLDALDAVVPEFVGPGPKEDAAQWFAAKGRTVDEKRAALRSNLTAVNLLPAQGRSMGDRLKPQWRYERITEAVTALGVEKGKGYFQQKVKGKGTTDAA